MPRADNMAPRANRRFHCGYLLKALASVALLLALGRCIENFPTLLVVIIWAASSAILAVGIAYPYCIRKISNCEMYLNESTYLKRANKRGGRLALCYALSLFLTSGLIIESMRWEGIELAVVAAAIPLYALISLLVNKLVVEKEFKPLYRQRASMLWSRIITGIVLALIFATATIVSGGENYSTFLEQLANTKSLSFGSESALLSLFSDINYLTTSAISYGISQFAGLPVLVFAAIKLIFCISSSFALAQLLSLCSLSRKEWKRVFLPIIESDDPKIRTRAILNSAISLVAVTVLFTGSFMLADRAVSKNSGGEFLPWLIKSLPVGDSTTVYEHDGKLIDKASLDAMFEEAVAENLSYTNQKQELIEHINQTYDSCEKNINAYLEWHSEQNANPIARFFGGLFKNKSTEPQDFESLIYQGVDTGSLVDQIDDYNRSIDGLQSQVEIMIEDPDFQGIAIEITSDAAELESYFAPKRCNAFLGLRDPMKTGAIDEDASDHEYKAALLAEIEKNRSAMIDSLSK